MMATLGVSERPHRTLTKDNQGTELAQFRDYLRSSGGAFESGASVGGIGTASLWSGVGA